MKILRPLALVFLLPFSLLSQTVPPLVNYQGRLSNPDGSPLATGDYHLSFSVFDAASSGNLVWGPEIFDGNAGQGHGGIIPAVQGYFNVLLGPQDTSGRSLAAAFNGTNRFIEVTVSNHPPVAPRQQILTAPFAFQAASALNAALASNVVAGINITNAVITGNGAGLTSLNASQLISGTLSDVRLAADVALTDANQTFAGQNSFSGNVGIGTNNPSSPLHVFSAGLLTALLDGSSMVGTWFTLRNTASGTNWHLIASGSGNGEGPGKLLFDVGPTPNQVSGSVLALTPNGYVGIGTTSPTTLLQVGSATCNGASWVNASDRNSKEDFDAINPRLVLEKVSALPITEWRYKVEADGTRHLGPVAQDFHAAFGLNGPDDKHIATVDEEGVALAAIQGLNLKVDEKNAEIQALTRRVNELEAVMNAMTGKK